MLSANELIQEALSFPPEERAVIVDSLLESMNPTDREIERKWAEVSKTRLRELRAGEAEGIPGTEVFRKIWERFSE